MRLLVSGKRIDQSVDGRRNVLARMAGRRAVEMVLAPSEPVARRTARISWTRKSERKSCMTLMTDAFGFGCRRTGTEWTVSSPAAGNFVSTAACFVEAALVALRAALDRALAAATAARSATTNGKARRFIGSGCGGG